MYLPFRFHQVGWVVPVCLVLSAPVTACPLDDPIPGDIPPGPFTLELAQRGPGMDFAIDPEMPPDGSGRIFVTLRDGRIVIVDDGVLLGTPFLDVSATTASNGGSAMSSLAFHPDFAVAGAPGEGLFYTVYQEPAGTAVAHFSGTAATAAHQSVIYEWRVQSGDPNLADVNSRREILRIDEDVTVHNVNDLAFGPDGYLYVARGDDDMRDDERLDGTTIFGSVLRIDVDDTSGNGRYGIPPDNPFVGNEDGIVEEIYAYGFRNNWRMSFDRQTGELYVADIGEDQVEEINIVQPGGYYGWIEKEGSFVFLGFPNPSDVCDDLDLLRPDFDGIDPVAQYDHTEGDRSITGGFVYRGTRIPPLVGHYVFGDWISGRLFNLDPVTREIQEIAIDPGGAPGGAYLGFGETADGELLIVTADFSASPASRLLEVVGGRSSAQRFFDVPPHHWAFSFIEDLAISGVTGGCDENLYCPSESVSRAQMAVFLERGMRGASFTPPAAAGNVFFDVGPQDFAAAFIEQLFADGITSGCGNGLYCPGAPVTRAQMAVFLLRARFGATYVPPPAQGLFADAPPGSFAAAWIEALAAEGITGGCGGGNFCPNRPVSRDQMAVFLVRTFDL